jgi:hypothetical protein
MPETSKLIGEHILASDIVMMLGDRDGGLDGMDGSRGTIWGRSRSRRGWCGARSGGLLKGSGSNLLSLLLFESLSFGLPLSCALSIRFFECLDILSERSQLLLECVLLLFDFRRTLLHELFAALNGSLPSRLSSM